MIDLESLADHQLVALATSIAREVARRDPEIESYAARSVRETIDAAAQDQKRIWEVKKRIGLAVQEVCGNDWHLHVWRSRDTGEVRVYLETEVEKCAQKWCLYVTGGSKRPPGFLGKFDLGWRASKNAVKIDDPKQIKDICQAAADLFPGGVRINCDVAAGFMPGSAAGALGIEDHGETIEA